MVQCAIYRAEHEQKDLFNMEKMILGAISDKPVMYEGMKALVPENLSTRSLNKSCLARVKISRIKFMYVNCHTGRIMHKFIFMRKPISWICSLHLFMSTIFLGGFEVKMCCYSATAKVIQHLDKLLDRVYTFSIFFLQQSFIPSQVRCCDCT